MAGPDGWAVLFSPCAAVVQHRADSSDCSPLSVSEWGKGGAWLWSVSWAACWCHSHSTGYLRSLLETVDGTYGCSAGCGGRHSARAAVWSGADLAFCRAKCAITPAAPHSPLPLLFSRSLSFFNSCCLVPSGLAPLRALGAGVCSLYLPAPFPVDWYTSVYSVAGPWGLFNEEGKARKDCRSIRVVVLCPFFIFFCLSLSVF